MSMAPIMVPMVYAVLLEDGNILFGNVLIMNETADGIPQPIILFGGEWLYSDQIIERLFEHAVPIAEGYFPGELTYDEIKQEFASAEQPVCNERLPIEDVRDTGVTPVFPQEVVANDGVDKRPKWGSCRYRLITSPGG